MSLRVEFTQTPQSVHFCIQSNLSIMTILISMNKWSLTTRYYLIQVDFNTGSTVDNDNGDVGHKSKQTATIT